jgi:hypothetical protein
MNTLLKKCITSFVLFQFFLISGLLPAARAEIISTQTFIESSAADQTRNELQTIIARDDVRGELIRLGVDPADAEQRLARLSADELQQLQGKMDQLPAGGSVLAIVGAVFLVLLILEIVGVTNVFNKI